MNTIDQIVTAFLTLYFLCGVIWGAVVQFYTIKCFKVFYCGNRECRFRNFCGSYKEPLTDEEAEILIKMLEDL